MNQYTTVLGFDFGTRKIGVAVGQALTKTAQPLTILKNVRGVPDWKRIDSLIKEWQPDALIVGVPIIIQDNTQPPITKLAMQFAQSLQQRAHLSVFTVDERLTTVEARSLTFAQSGYRGLQKKQIDAIAAALIIEDWFNQW